MADDGTAEGVPYGPAGDHPVARAAMVHWWDQLTFVHYSFPPETVQRLLPRGLTVQTRQGQAWVSLVPFFLRVGLPGVPSVRWLSRFAETNVRTYVCSEDGTSGIWFFSLDAARLGAVLVARATYRTSGPGCASSGKARRCGTTAVDGGPGREVRPAWSRSRSASASR